MISRRQLLAALTTLPAGWQARGTQEDTFPFKRDVMPLKPKEAVFPPVSYRPSFLHPNGTQVMLASSKGDLVLWDWRTGKPGATWPGHGKASTGDLPLPPCRGLNPAGGAFSSDGRHWVWNLIEGNDGGRDCSTHACGATGRYRALEWGIGFQIDPTRPWLHFLWEDPLGKPREVELRRLDLPSGEARTRGKLRTRMVPAFNE